MMRNSRDETKGKLERRQDEPVVLAFVDEIRRIMAELNEELHEDERWQRLDRVNRLLAFVRLRKSRELVALARDLAEWEETKWHALEILRRNGLRDEEMPKVPKWDWLKIHAKTGVCLIWIPSGEFLMGSPEDDETAANDQKPQHRVVIREGFWMGKYPITNAEHGRFVVTVEGLPSRESANPKCNAWDQPVVRMNWEDAQRYSQWAGCELPNEAEWEYACWEGTTGYSLAGKKEGQHKRGWNAGPEVWPECELPLEWQDGIDFVFGESAVEDCTSHGVGLLRRNGNGLSDMYGNVTEWCSDIYDHDAYRKRKDGWGARVWDVSDLSAPLFMDWGVMRGGGAHDVDEKCCTEVRLCVGRDCSFRFQGFRIVCREGGPVS